MSEQENVNNPTPAPAGPDLELSAAVAQALEPHAGKLVPGGASQLSRLLASDLAGVPTRLVGEIVEARLKGDTYRHFLAKPTHPAARPPQQPAAASAAPPTEAELVEGIRARFQASQGANLLGGLGRRGD